MPIDQRFGTSRSCERALSHLHIRNHGRSIASERNKTGRRKVAKVMTDLENKSEKSETDGMSYRRERCPRTSP